MMLVVAWMSWPYVADSWIRGEVSREAGGMPALYLLKTTIIVFAVLMILQGLSLAARSYLFLTGRTYDLGPDPAADGGS